jgi:hypothetical protein
MCRFELDIRPGTAENAVEFNSNLERQGLMNFLALLSLHQFTNIHLSLGGCISYLTSISLQVYPYRAESTTPI